MNILALPRFDKKGASSRYRMYQYIPFLEKAGIHVDVQPLLDASYLDDLYAGNHASAKKKGAAAGFRRLRMSGTLGDFDAVWLEKEALPWYPFRFEKYCLRKARKLVVDLDDAQFHRYDQHHSALVRGVLGAKFKKLFRRADQVVCGNQYLAEQCGEGLKSPPLIIPTVVDTQRYTDAEPRFHDGRFTIGWMGSPSTTKHLLAFEGVWKKAARHANWRVVLVGADRKAFNVEGVEHFDWSEADEADLVKSFDVGVMPLTDTPWEKGKCGLKLIQYMAAGLPVVASPVGVNTELVKPGVNGYLAETEEEWLHSLVALSVDVEERETLGRAGRTIVEDGYNLEKTAEKMVRLFKELGDSSCAG